MDKLKAAIKCPKCQKVFSNPVLLSCGHSMCQEHISAKDEQVVCFKCDKLHINSGFVVNQVLVDIIEARIGSIDFGPAHKDANNSCARLEEGLENIENVLNDLPFTIHESVSELKNKVNLKSEELKLLIDDASHEIIKHLDEYEKQCIANLRTKFFQSALKELTKWKSKCRENLKKWFSCLNELKYDEEKFNQIKLECEPNLNEMEQNLHHFKKKALMNQESEKRLLVDCFSEINIQPLLKNV